MGGAPILNDVATDLTSPPEFVKKSTLNPLPEDFKKPIAEYYTELKPLRVPKSLAGTFDACIQAARQMPRWTIEYQDAEAGIIEGVARTKLLRFKDDFVIRLSGSEGETVIDMRSKSRLGKGDLGANAERIQQFFVLVRSEAGMR
eukprot:jgi/Ulvmu1/10571/UM065_0025.1